MGGGRTVPTRVWPRRATDVTSGWLLTAFTAGGTGQAHAQPARRRFPAGCVGSAPKPRSRTWQGLGVCDWPFLRRGGGRKSPRLPSPRRVTAKDTRTWQGHRGPRGHRGPGSSRCPDTCARADSGPFQPETPAPPIVQVPAPGGRRVALLSRARGPEHTPLLAAALTHAVRREAGGPRSPRPSSHPGGGGGRAPWAGAAAGPGRGGRLSRGRWGRRPSRGAASPGQELPLRCHLLVVAGPVCSFEPSAPWLLPAAQPPTFPWGGARPPAWRAPVSPGSGGGSRRRAGRDGRGAFRAGRALALGRDGAPPAPRGPRPLSFSRGGGCSGRRAMPGAGPATLAPRGAGAAPPRVQPLPEHAARAVSRYVS